MEVRSFFKLLNRSSWHFRYKTFYTKVQNLKFVWCEAEIPWKFVKKFHSLVRNIYGDIICGSQVFFQAPKQVIVEFAL